MREPGPVPPRFIGGAGKVKSDLYVLKELRAAK